MKKTTHHIIYACLVLILGLLLSCSEEDSSSSETDTSTSSAVTISGKVQKGPYVQGTEITVRELDSTMTPTGNTFTGTIDDNTGSFSIKGTLTDKIAELAADGYYFNEVSGSLSSAKLSLQALSDLTDRSSVNVNLMTHLEKKRVEYLMDNSKMTFAAAKTQAQTEIMKIFNIENVTLGNSETLDISQSGNGNAVLLAISAILQSDKTEAELTELLSTINTDIRTDGTLDSTNTKATLVTAMEYLKSRRSTIRTNIESRYSNLGISATIPAFESFAFKLDSTVPTVFSTSDDNGSSSSDNDSASLDNSYVLASSSISVNFSDSMDSTSLTTNTTNTNCTGSFQISSDNFSSCINMASNPTASNDTKTFTVTPSSNFSNYTTYKIRITTAAKDVGGNTLSEQFTTTTGFTAVVTPTIKWFEGYTGGYSYGTATPGASSGGASGAGGGGACSSYSYQRITFQSGTKYVAQSLTPSSSITPTLIGVGLTGTCPNRLLVKSDSSGSPGTTSNTLTFTTFNVSPVLWTSLNDSGGTSYTIEKTCVTSISSGSSFTLSSGTKYWLVFEYSSSPSSLYITDQDSSASNSSSDLKHSVDGSSWSKTPTYNFTQENPSNCGASMTLSYSKRMRLFLAE